MLGANTSNADAKQANRRVNKKRKKKRGYSEVIPRNSNARLIQTPRPIN